MKNKNLTHWLIFILIALSATLTVQVKVNTAKFDDYSANSIFIPGIHKITITSPNFKEFGTYREVTMYNVGDIYQTDNSPCISANSENICEAVRQGFKRCAANFVPLGTDLIIENYGECKVTDRMNSRYKNRVDIAVSLDEYERAIDFGKQTLKVIIK